MVEFHWSNASSDMTLVHQSINNKGFDWLNSNYYVQNY